MGNSFVNRTLINADESQVNINLRHLRNPDLLITKPHAAARLKRILAVV